MVMVGVVEVAMKEMTKILGNGVSLKGLKGGLRSGFRGSMKTACRVRVHIETLWIMGCMDNGLYG